MAPVYAVKAVAHFYPDLSRQQIEYRLRRATFVGLERRYLYYEVPKAGCTSMKTLIHAVEKLPKVTPFAGSQREVRRDMFIHERDQFRLPSLLDFDNPTQEAILRSAGFFRFTIVRNPYARLQSAWLDKVRLCAPGQEGLYHALKGALPTARDPGSIISFAEFVRSLSRDQLATCNQHWRLQTAHLFWPAIEFSMIGRLEQFDAVAAAFCAHIGLGSHPIPSMNHSGTATEFDEDLARLVYSLYRADFDTFEYRQDDWPRPADGATEPRTIPESRYVDELIERNIVIGQLYEERDRLLARQFRSRCHRLARNLKRLIRSIRIPYQRDGV